MQISALIQSVWQNNDIYIFQQFNVGHFIILGIKMFAVRRIEPVIITYFFWFPFFHLKSVSSGQALLTQLVIVASLRVFPQWMTDLKTIINVRFAVLFRYAHINHGVYWSLEFILKLVEASSTAHHPLHMTLVLIPPCLEHHQVYELAPGRFKALRLKWHFWASI